MTSQEALDVLFNDLSFCTCDDVETTLEWVVLLFEDLQKKDFPALERRSVLLGHGPMHSLLFWLEGANLIEHGSNILCPWLSPHGESFLEAVRGKTLKELRHPKLQGKKP